MAVVAVIQLDATAFKGPIVPTATGFNWRLFSVVHDTVTNQKESLQGYSADTLDGDSLIQVRDKLIQATKDAAAQLNPPMGVTIAVLPQMTIVNPA